MPKTNLPFWMLHGSLMDTFQGKIFPNHNDSILPLFASNPVAGTPNNTVSDRGLTNGPSSILWNVQELESPFLFLLLVMN